jgi:hypothetical protein
MPASFWIISVLVFALVTYISVKNAIRFYKRTFKQEWQAQRPLNMMTVVRGALPLCLVITVLIMLVVKYLFYS